jgi:hypothetical protein
MGLGLGLEWGCSLGFSPLGCSTDFSSLGFSTSFPSLGFSLSFPKNTFPEVIMNLMGFWKSSVCGGNTGGARLVSSRFLRWLGVWTKAFLWWVFGGSGIFSLLPSPTHQLSQLIILILQTINIMCKFQILQSMQFTGRARSRNWFF